MRTFIRHFLAVFLIASFVPSLQAVTLSLSTNQAVYVPSDTLKLSGGIVPSNDDANVLSDVYVAVVLPDGSIFTLAPNLTWDATLTPILKAFPIANIQAPNFYSLSIPESLPKGTYTFYLVATPTNSNPLDSSLWLGSITTTINISTTPTCTPPQVLQNNLCVKPTPTCTSPQVLQNGICVTPTPTCTSPQVLQNGVCVTPTPTCTSPQVLQNGVCVTPTPTCTSPQVLQNGICVTPTPNCISPQVLQNGVCVTPTPTCASPQVLQNGICVTPTPTCTSPQVLQNGVCVIPLPGITPTINQLYPTQASSATKVVVKGSGFTSLSKISLGDQTITPEFISDTQLSFVVPFGLNQNGALIPFQAGEYPVKVDDSDPVNFTVIDLPDNPNPPGQLLAEQTSSLFENIAVVASQFQSQLPQFLSEQHDNPSAQIFINDLANLINYINSPAVRTALTSLTNQIDQQSLDTLERFLLANQNANTALASPAIAQASPAIAKYQPKMAVSTKAQSLTTSSCQTLTNGDDWLACRSNLTNSAGVNLLNDAQSWHLIDSVMKNCGDATKILRLLQIPVPKRVKAVLYTCKYLDNLANLIWTSATAEINNNAGTLKGFTLNISGLDSSLDTIGNTNLFNPTELDINLHLNNYDNNQNVALQTAKAKHINGATLNISTTVDWAQISAKLAQTNATTGYVDTGNSDLDTIDTLLRKLAVDIVNASGNTPRLNLQISKAYISSTLDGAFEGSDVPCNEFLLGLKQNTDLKWLVNDMEPLAILGQYIGTLNGCEYRINKTYRLPSEEDIDTHILFKIKRYPEITVNVNGSGYVTYEVPALSGHQSCTREMSPCTEYFDLSPKFNLESDLNFTDIEFTAYNSDGTLAKNTTWAGDKIEKCTDNASCLITPDPTNVVPPVITATTGFDCAIGAKGPAGGIVFYINPDSTEANCHGLEVAPEDQALSTWGCWHWATYYDDRWTTVGSTGTAIGTGAANTQAIIAACGISGGATVTSAAETAAAYTLNGYSDWYLPSIGELNQLYLNKNSVGFFDIHYYWSSTESDFTGGSDALLMYNWDGNEYSWFKSMTSAVRAVRSF